MGGTLADIWLREGWGRWTYIDPDQLLPHNLARHVGLDSGVGYAKVDVVRHHAQMMFPDEPEPKAIAGSLTSRSEEVMSALGSATLVIDATTNFDAPRDLAERENAPRTASMLLTPSGLASVILLEDASRTLMVTWGIYGQVVAAVTFRFGFRLSTFTCMQGSFRSNCAKVFCMMAREYACGQWTKRRKL